VTAMQFQKTSAEHGVGGGQKFSGFERTYRWRSHAEIFFPWRQLLRSIKHNQNDQIIDFTGFGSRRICEIVYLFPGGGRGYRNLWRFPIGDRRGSDAHLFDEFRNFFFSCAGRKNVAKLGGGEG